MVSKYHWRLALFATESAIRVVVAEVQNKRKRKRYVKNMRPDCELGIGGHFPPVERLSRSLFLLCSSSSRKHNTRGNVIPICNLTCKTGPKSRSRSTRGKKTPAAHEETRGTAPKQPKCLAGSHKPATSGGGEHAEYIARFMEAWKHQADIVRWVPNPRAPEFIPRGMGSQSYYGSAVVAEAVILDEQLCDTIQAQYEEVH